MASVWASLFPWRHFFPDVSRPVSSELRPKAGTTGSQEKCHSRSRLCSPQRDWADANPRATWRDGGRARFSGGQVVLPEGNSGRYRFGHTVWGTADKWCLPEWGGEMFSAVLVKECPALCLSYINPKAAISKEAQVCPAGVARAQLHGPCVKQRPWKDKFTSPERRQHRTQITAHSPPVSTPHACMDIC